MASRRAKTLRWLNAQSMRLLLVLLIAFAVSSVSERAWAGAKEDARRHFANGMALVDAGQYAEGIELLKKAYELKPHRNVLFNIARAYVQKGDVDRAIEYFERYLETAPPDADKVRAMLAELDLRRRLRGLVDEGMRAIQAGRVLEGIALLTRAYEERPHRNLLFNIARAYESLGDGARAIETYERYLETSPADATKVRARVARLRTRLAAATKRTKPSPRPPAGGGRRKSGKRAADGRGAPATSGVPVAVSTPEDEAARAAKIAELVIEKMRAEGLVGAPAQGLVPDTELSRGPVSSEGAPGLGGAPDVSAGLGGTGETGAAADGAEDEVGEQLVTDLDSPSGVDGLESSPVAGLVLPTDTSTGGVRGGAGAGVGLAPKTGEVYEDVVVTASRRAQSPLDAPNAVTIITEEDIRLSGARSIPDLLRRVPGTDVIAMSFSDFNISVRGFNSRLANKLLVLVDGRTVYQDFLGVTVWGTLSISLADIERIEVIRGPGSAVYGAYAYTGIVNIITKRPEQVHGALGEVSVGNGRNVGGTFQYGERKGPLGVRVSGSYQRADKYELEFDPKRVDYTTNVTNPNKSIDSFRCDLLTEYNFDDDTRRAFLGAGVWSGFNELYGVSSLRNQAVQGQEYHVRAGVDGEVLSLRAFWTGLRVTSTPQFYRTGLDDLGSRIHSDLVSLEPLFKPTLEFLGTHAMVFGGEYRFKRIEWDYLRANEEEHHFAVFFQDEWAVVPEFSVLLSGRLDLHPLIGPLASPRAAFILKPTPKQAIRATVGTAFRQPTMAETYLDLAASSPVAGSAIRLVGEPKLDPENIVTVDVGYLYQADFGEFESVFYLNRVSNLVNQTPLISTGVQQSFDPSIPAFVSAESLYYNEDRVYLALGSEISGRLYPVDGVDVGLSYAFQYIFDVDNGARVENAPLHKATAWTQIRTDLGVDVGLAAHFVSSQNWIEQQFDPDDPSGFAQGTLPVDASLMLTGRVGYRLLQDRLELAVSGTNLLDFGSLRHREHPFANRVEARLLVSLTARF
ncbi:MAG: TonB-dependent receptor [Deltaproteobacteria bacterium]|nr:TonB-dependent receptor [Deltaproteobacteria bacterium]